MNGATASNLKGAFSLSRPIVAVAIGSLALPSQASGVTSTAVGIRGTKFTVNGRVTYPGRRTRGLLLNSRMANAVFDDENPDTVGQWAYPDTHVWDPQRNTDEFIAMLPFDRSFRHSVDDRYSGGESTDIIGPGRGDDRLLGQAGVDILRSGKGSDVLRGGPAADCLFSKDGVGGNDRGSGGPGRDTYYADKGDHLRSVERKGLCGP